MKIHRVGVQEKFYIWDESKFELIKNDINLYYNRPHAKDYQKEV